MADDEHNPYAAPAPAPVELREPSGTYAYDGPNEYEAQRRPVLLTIVFSVVTLGFYPSIWLIQRQSFLDRRGVGKTLGGGLPIFVLVTNIIGFVLAIVGQEAAKLRPVFTLLGGISLLVANFRVLGILRSDAARTGRFLDFSPVWTFFFGCYYLQRKINQMADTPARVERPRKKKKKKARVEAAADATADDAEPAAAAESESETAKVG